MILNPFVIKKNTALLLNSMISTMFFFMGIQFYGLLWGVLFLVIGSIIGIVLGKLLLANPFSSMLEGKGILTLDISSTGILRIFVVAVNPPHIQGKIGNKIIKDVFNREAVFSLAPPIDAEINAEQITKGKNKGGIKIEIGEEELNKSRFGLFHYPLLIHNSQTGSLMTKDQFSEQEKDTQAEHLALYLNTTMQELTSHVRDFARYIVESLKPGKGIKGGKWILLVVIFIILIGLGIVFLPAIMNAAGPVGSSIGSAAQAIGQSGGVITPI